MTEKGPEPSKLWTVLRWTGDLFLGALCLLVVFNHHPFWLCVIIPIIAAVRLAAGPEFAGVSLIFCSAWLAYYVSDGSPRGRLRACEANLEQIHLAIEKYADRFHEPPRTLDQLIPTYISGIPICPNHPQDQYSVTYKAEPNGHYTMCCMNSHFEAGLPPFHPVYSSSKGLQER